MWHTSLRGNTVIYLLKQGWNTEIMSSQLDRGVKLCHLSQQLCNGGKLHSHVLFFVLLCYPGDTFRLSQLSCSLGV